MITDRRSRLGDDIIEAIECMKSWRKAGLISEKPLAEVEQMLGDLEERATKSGPGTVASSGGSALGSDISGI